MPRFKNIRIKMANGKSRLQRAQVLASGKLKFVKNKARSAHRHVKSGARHVKHRITKRKSPTKAPVKRNSTSRSKSSMTGLNFLKKIPIINSPIAKKIFIAAGAVSIIVSVLSLISPKAAGMANSTVGRGVIGLATGDVIGAASNVLIPLIQGGSLGNLTGGSSNSAVQGTAGFA